MSFEPRDYLRHIQIEINFLIQASAGVVTNRIPEGICRGIHQDPAVVDQGGNRIF